MTSTELFAALPAPLAEDILEFSHANDRKLYHAAVEAVAQSRKLRAVFLERQPRAERYATMRASLSRPGLSVAADSLVRNWLLKKHATVLVDFMEALQIKHENGVVSELPPTVEDAALQNAVNKLLAGHSAEVVAVYLHAFNAMNGEHWGNLDALLKSDARLALGK